MDELDLELIREKRREKKREEARRKFKLMLFLFLITGAMLSTGTYAWFSSNRIVYIEFFNVHVETDGGMQISADGDEWKSVLTLEDLISVHEGLYTTSTNQIPYQMRPVSTIGEIDRTSGFMKMYFGAAENDGSDNYILSTTRDVEERGSGLESDGNFIAFDVFLKTTGAKDMYLSGESYVKVDGEDSSVGIENSSRVAFVYEGNTTSDNNIAIVQGLSEATNDDVYIWEPNYDLHTESGVENARKIFGITTTETGGKQLGYYGVKQEFSESEHVYTSEADPDHYPNYFGKVNVDIATTSDNTANNFLITVPDGITKLRIYMWLEGQDVDSENNASYGNVDFYLQFTLNS